jgi:hypothetical protein
MKEHIEERFENETVILDDCSFIDCVFDNCILEYQGTADCHFKSNQIVRSRFSLTGPAARTLSFLRGLHGDMGPNGPVIVQTLLANYFMEPLENFDGPVFKYLPEIHARSMVENGEVRIGTLWSFQSTETHGDEIGDRREGVVESLLIKDYDPKRDKQPLPDLSNAGIKLGPGPFENCVIEFPQPRSVVMRNYYIYCVTKDYDPEMYEKFGNEYDTCVEILKPKTFFNTLIRTLRPRIENARVASCFYGDKKAIYDQGLEMHPARIKDPKYSYQNEARLFCKPADLEIEPFNIKNPDITKICKVFARKGDK